MRAVRAVRRARRGAEAGVRAGVGTGVGTGTVRMRVRRGTCGCAGPAGRAGAFSRPGRGGGVRRRWSAPEYGRTRGRLRPSGPVRGGSPRTRRIERERASAVPPVSGVSPRPRVSPGDVPPADVRGVAGDPVSAQASGHRERCHGRGHGAPGEECAGGSREQAVRAALFVPGGGAGAVRRIDVRRPFPPGHEVWLAGKNGGARWIPVGRAASHRPGRGRVLGACGAAPTPWVGRSDRFETVENTTETSPSR